MAAHVPLSVSVDRLPRAAVVDYAGPKPGRRRARRIGPGTIALVLLVGGLLAALGYLVSVPLAGILYAVLIVGLTFVRPDVTFLIVFTAAPFVYDLAGGGPVSIAVADLTVVLAFPALLVRFVQSGRRFPRNPTLLPVLAYLAVCVASTALSGMFAEGTTALVQVGLYTLLNVYAFAAGTEDPAELNPAFYGLLASNAVVAVAVLYFRSNYVLGMHKNGIGAELSYAVTIAAELWLARAAAGRRRRLLTVVLLVLVAGLVNSLSRGAWLGTAVGVGVLLALRRQVKLAVQGLLAVVPAVVVCWFLLPSASREYAVDFGHGAANIQARYQSMATAWRLFTDHPIFGVGLAFRKLADATNLVLDTLAETGVPGLVTFAAIFVAFGWMVVKARRRLTPTDPAFSLLAIGAALMAGKVAHGCVDHYWSRVMLPVWAAAGLAVYAYNRSLARPGRGFPVVFRERP